MKTAFALGILMAATLALASAACSSPSEDTGQGAGGALSSSDPPAPKSPSPAASSASSNSSAAPDATAVSALFAAPRTPIMSVASASDPGADTPMVWKLSAVQGGLIASFVSQLDDTTSSEIGILLDTSNGKTTLKSVAVMTASGQDADPKALLQLLRSDLDAAAANIPEFDLPSGLDTADPGAGGASCTDAVKAHLVRGLTDAVASAELLTLSAITAPTCPTVVGCVISVVSAAGGLAAAAATAVELAEAATACL
jgi:hypothetical protein